MINCAVMRYVLPIVLFGLLLAACGGSRLPDARGHAAGPQVAEQSPPAKDAPSNAVEEKDPPELPPDTGKGFGADKMRKDMGGPDIGRELKVLYIEQRFRWQARYLNEAMKRDKHLAYQGFFFDAQEGWTQPTSNWSDEVRSRVKPLRWPMYADGKIVRTRDDFLALNYDVILLGDIDPLSECWRDEYLDWIEEWVKRGGGLILASGAAHNPWQFGGNETFQRLCPVKIEVPDDTRIVNSQITKYLWLTEAGREHFILKLSGDEERNNELWGQEKDGRYEAGQLHGIYWHAVTGKAVEGASVLANVTREGFQVPDEQPLIVTKTYGKGRVFWVGTDDTWQWRQYVGDYYFYKFWQHAVLWAAGEGG